MTPSTPSIAEQLSALADGQTSGADLDRLLQACATDPQSQALWRDCHLIGEALRGAATSAQGDGLQFLARLRPALMAPPSAAPQQPPQPQPRGLHAANAPWFLPRWAAGIAGLAVVAALVWNGVGGPEDGGEALGGSPVLATTAQGPVVRDAALDELLEAHRQQGGASVLPMPSGFLRNATFDAEPSALPGPR